MSVAFEALPIELDSPDDFETAIEASCGALMVVEVIRSHAPASADEVASVQARLQEAIECLRRAITQLRMARSETVFPLAAGFVAASPLDRRFHG